MPSVWLDSIAGYFIIDSFYCTFSDSPFIIDKCKKSVASTILGDDNFIKKITKKYLTDKNKDRNLPALREIKKSVSIDSIYKKVRFLLGDNDSIARKASVFYCHRFNGVPLKEIGTHFGISESGVSLASSRFSQVLQRNKKLWEKIEQVQNQLNL